MSSLPGLMIPYEHGYHEDRGVIAVVGNTMRAARTDEDPAPHLLAALDHATSAVLTQQRVADKSNQRSRL